MNSDYNATGNHHIWAKRLFSVVSHCIMKCSHQDSCGCPTWIEVTYLQTGDTAHCIGHPVLYGRLIWPEYMSLLAMGYTLYCTCHGVHTTRHGLHTVCHGLSTFCDGLHTICHGLHTICPTSSLKHISSYWPQAEDMPRRPRWTGVKTSQPTQSCWPYLWHFFMLWGKFEVDQMCFLVASQNTLAQHVRRFDHQFCQMIPIDIEGHLTASKTVLVL